tara:strand:- start:2711 stop:4039 length:1329 start_codon:yes stop_codon:yes gene_type:complete
MKSAISEVVSAPRVTEGRLEDHNLSEELYLTVLAADLGKAGVVNKNNRVYKVDEFVEQNRVLAERVQKEFVDGEAGHPSGSSTFDVPVRLVGVSVDVDEGTATAVGNFAIVNTQIGRDILTLYRAGMPIGVSSRGEGLVERHVIDEESPFWENNINHRGKSVQAVSEFELHTYDLVRAPSAGTHVKRVTQEAEEAFLRLCDSGIWAETQNQKMEDIDMSKKEKDVPAVAPAAEIGHETVEVAEQAPVVQDRFAGLTDSQRDTLIRLAAVIESAEDESSDDELVEQVRRVADQADVDRYRLAESEAKNRQLSERLEVLETTLAAEKHAKEMAAAISENVKAKPFGARIAGVLKSMVEEGRLHDADDVALWAVRVNDMLEGVDADKEVATGDVVIEAIDAEDDLVENEEVSSAPEVVAPGLLNEEFSQTLKQIIDRDRSVSGRA